MIINTYNFIFSRKRRVGVRTMDTLTRFPNRGITTIHTPPNTLHDPSSCHQFLTAPSLLPHPYPTLILACTQPQTSMTKTHGKLSQSEEMKHLAN